MQPRRVDQWPRTGRAKRITRSELHDGHWNVRLIAPLKQAARQMAAGTALPNRSTDTEADLWSGTGWPKPAGLSSKER